MTEVTRSARARLLNSAGAAVLATLIAGSAHAADTIVDSTGVAVAVTGHKTAQSALSNAGDIGAVLTNEQGGITQTGDQTGTSNSLTANTISAAATGNTFTNTIDLSLTAAEPSDGAASLGAALNESGADVTSLVEGSELAVSLDGFQDGSAVNTGNSITANTTVNNGVSSIAGTVPGGYVSTASGSSTLNFPANGDTDLFNAAGSVVVSSIQESLNTNSSANTDSNTVALSLTASENNTIVAGPVLDDNTIAANFSGNSARNTADLQSGDSPAFAGSAVVSNMQALTADEEAASSATNLNSTIGASVYGSEGTVNTLNGALSVQGNTIAASANGNTALGTALGVAGNRILLGDGLSFVGAGNEDPAGSSIAYDAGDTSSDVIADLIIQNSQGVSGASQAPQGLASTVIGGVIAADVQSLDGGAVSLADNSITAAVTGSAASNAIASGANAAVFEGTVAVANQQVNYNTDIAARTINSEITAVTGTDDGLTRDSSVSVTGNKVTATGYGASVTQNVALAATTLDIGQGQVSLTGGTGPDGNVSATGGATIANLQSGYNSVLTVANTGSVIGLDADARGETDTLSANSLSTKANTQEAVALGNSAGNVLSLNGANVGSGAGVASVQILDEDSSVSATLVGAATGLIASTHVVDSQLAVTNNLQRAIGYGGSVSNELNVTANQLAVEGDAGPASTIAYDVENPRAFSDTNLPVVEAAFGLLNDQTTQADITATALQAGSLQAGLNLVVEGDLASSSSNNDTNAFVAAAYGNDAANKAALNTGNIATSDGAGFSSVAAISNTQAVDSAIAATATGGNVVLTAIEDAVTDSNVSTSNNAVQALAYGNRATANTLTVKATNIDTAASDQVAGGMSSIFSDGDTQLTADASFSVQNAQSAEGSISASQRDSLEEATTAAGVLTVIGGPVTDATVVSNANRSTAAATANSAVNGVAITANNVATTSGVQNLQVTNANLSAFIGLPGVAGTDATDDTDAQSFSFVTTGSGITGVYSEENQTWTIGEGNQSVDVGQLDADEVTALLNSGGGWTQPGGAGTALQRSAAGRVVSSEIYTGLTEGSGATLNGTVPMIPGTLAVAATPNTGGVTVAVNDAISGSAISVDGNVTAGSVIGNDATNSLTLTATTIVDGNGMAASIALPVAANEAAQGAIADHAVSNIQIAGPAALTSEVYGAFAIDAVEGAAINGSTLSVSDNAQSATAIANTAANGIQLTGNEISAGTALTSAQESQASVSALSDVDIYAPAAVNGSTVDISGNSNTALAVINDVANTLVVSGTNVAPGGAANVQLSYGGAPSAMAMGDHVLSNVQNVDAETSVTGTASTTLYNEDRINETGSGLTDSSLTISGNSTAAEASANRAVNTVALNGAAVQGANAGLANVQSSGAAVTANATTSATVVLAGGVENAALNGSSVALDANSTTALARGNAATNALNVTAGSGYGATSNMGAGGSAAGSQMVQAQAAVLNSQNNFGAVSASSQNATYMVALNSGAGGPGVSNSTVGVTGNRVASEAYGNTATNRLTVTALNTGTPTAAVNNFQRNAGAITATTTTVSFGVVAGNGSVNGSTLGVSGNQISATAIGNSAVSSIMAAR